MTTEAGLRVILGNNLKRYRKSRSFTQAGLAEKINISIPFLSDIENGKKWISPHTLAKITEILDIEAYELLKPEKTLPDKATNIILKYTSDVYGEMGKVLEKLCAEYIEKLVKK